MTVLLDPTGERAPAVRERLARPASLYGLTVGLLDISKPMGDHFLDRIEELLTERGVSFGYNNLVSDMRSLAVMRDTGCPVVFDATHSVQLPGGQGNSSGGQREFVPVLARAAIATGVSGVFMETHPDPSKALSDGPNAWPLAKMRALLETMLELDAATKRGGFLESTL
mgnify:CR=1 FL=1